MANFVNKSRAQLVAGGQRHYPSPPNERQIAEMKSWTVETHRPEWISGISEERPDEDGDFEILFRIDLLRDRRGGGEELFCPVCQHGNHFLKGGMLWCGDGKLRLIGWKCLETLVGTTKFQEIERKHKRQQLRKAAEDFLFDNLGSIRQILDRLKSLERGSKEVHRLRTMLSQSLNEREYAGFNRLLRKGDGVLKSPRRHKLPDGRIETSLEEVGRIPVGRLFDPDFQPKAMADEIRTSIAAAVNAELLEAGEGTVSDGDIEDLALGYLGDLSEDAMIEAHKALEGALQQMKLLEAELGTALRFATPSTIATLRACRGVPLLSALDIRVDHEKGFILAAEGKSPALMRWPS